MQGCKNLEIKQHTSSTKGGGFALCDPPSPERGKEDKYWQ